MMRLSLSGDSDGIKVMSEFTWKKSQLFQIRLLEITSWLTHYNLILLRSPTNLLFPAQQHTKNIKIILKKHRNKKLYTKIKLKKQELPKQLNSFQKQCDQIKETIFFLFLIQRRCIFIGHESSPAVIVLINILVMSPGAKFLFWLR